MPMSPGTYLEKRRLAAGLTLDQLARSLANLPWAIRPAREEEVQRLSLRLKAAEQNEVTMTLNQLGLMRNAFAFDPGVYMALADLHHGGPGSGLPEPQVCRECGCSWFVACETPRGPCAWSDHNADLCTACDPAYAGLPGRVPPATPLHLAGERA